MSLSGESADIGVLPCLCETSAGSSEQRLGRLIRDVELVSDLGDRTLVEVPECERRPLPFRKCTEGGQHVVGDNRRCLRLITILGLALSRQPFDAPLVPFLRSPLVDHSVPGHDEQPWSVDLIAPTGGEVPRCGRESFGGGVIGGGGVAGSGQTVAVEGIEFGIEQSGQAVPVVRARRVDDLAVFADAVHVSNHDAEAPNLLRVYALTKSCRPATDPMAT